MEATGVIMGEMEMIKISTGEKTTFKIDGTVIKENEPIKIDWCDKCERWKSMEFGRYEKADGITMLWFCGECK
jgi:hypothetical protein